MNTKAERTKYRRQHRQDKRNEDIPELCFIITELDEFCEQETVIGDSRMLPELCE